ncbi:MAG: Holliday junction branch migration protein RuvA [Candidatus Eisenbacteria bacterium]
MIAYVDGVLAEKSAVRAVVDVGGVGFALMISLSTYEDLPREGARARLFTHPYLREETMQLFGFSTKAELDLFRLLLLVPGVGPKLALSVLSAMRPESFRRSVVEGDTATLSRIPGIGKKSAERLVVELRSRFKEPAIGEAALAAAGVSGEARLALEALGFKTDRASRAIAKVLALREGSEPTVEELVREALAHV